MIHNRRSIRLKGYDYSMEGLYFITICVKNRATLFGRVINGELELNDIGRKAEECWLEIPRHFPNILLRPFVIMPNHVHGILEISKSSAEDTENHACEKVAGNHMPLRTHSRTIGSVVRGFKIGLTKWVRQNTDVQTVWHRNYYEHIIRDERSYHAITAYIFNNPKNWQGG